MTLSAISEARKQTLQTRMGCGLTWWWSDRSWSEPSRVWSVQCIVGVSCVLLSGWIVLFFWCIASRLARRTLVELLTLAACCYAASDKSWHLVPGSLHLPACLVIVTPTAQPPLHWIHSGRIAWPCWSKAFGRRGLRQTTHQGQLVGVEGYSRKTAWPSVWPCWRSLRIGIRWVRQESGPAGNIVWVSSPLKTFFLVQEFDFFRASNESELSWVRLLNAKQNTINQPHPTPNT